MLTQITDLKTVLLLLTGKFNRLID